MAAIEGDWGFVFADEDPEGGNTARLTLRAGVVFEGGAKVGAYTVAGDAIALSLGNGTFVGSLSRVGEHVIPGTFTSGDPDPISDPAMLLRAVEQPSTH